MTTLRLALLSAVAFCCAPPAQATEVWNQGFETDTTGWFDENSTWNGTATQVPTGTNGITSKSGSGHAIFTESAATGSEPTGPFTRFDGYRDTWPSGGLTASVDVYLDTSWAAGEGFEYSVAANGSDGAHQRDFVFHVTKDTSTGSLLVGGSNNANTDGSGVRFPREDLENVNSYAVPTTGWYTLEHLFRDAGDGTLAVDLNLRSATGSLLFTETRNAAADVIATDIGGNRYGWFTNIDIAGGIAVDNHTLSVVPEPAALATCLPLLGMVFGVRRR